MCCKTKNRFKFVKLKIWISNGPAEDLSHIINTFFSLHLIAKRSNCRIKIFSFDLVLVLIFFLLFAQLIYYYYMRIERHKNGKICLAKLSTLCFVLWFRVKNGWSWEILCGFITENRSLKWCAGKSLLRIYSIVCVGWFHLRHIFMNKE